VPERISVIGERLRTALPVFVIVTVPLGGVGVPAGTTSTGLLVLPKLRVPSAVPVVLTALERPFALTAANEMTGAGAATPSPISVALWLLPTTPFTSSLTLTVADWLAAVSGLKTTEMVQDAPAARLVTVEERQVVVRLYEPLAAPVRAMLLILRAAVPGFESVMVCAALATLTVVFGKMRLLGVRIA
jgi:hypothetical protein